jgi:hypothetical protein
MIYTVIGLLLLIPFGIATDIGAKVHNPNIPPHRKPGIVDNPSVWAIFNLVWFLLLAGSIGFLIAGAGWWTLLLFPAGLVVLGGLHGVIVHYLSK